MDASIDEIERVLRDELAPLDSEASRLQDALDAIDEKRSRLTAALEALGGRVLKAKSPRRSKPCATQAEVIQVVTELLFDNGSLAVDDLEGLVKDRIKTDHGKSLSGFRLRFQEALRDDRFERGLDGQYRLVVSDQRTS